MINKLHIKNFQSHADSTLVFSPGINLICGSSNNGKTAILRALNWIVSNKPQGIAFKSSFSDKKESCRVELEINGNKIVREKSNTINLYKVGSSVFSTIGNDIPSEVNSAININEINISNQFEKHFLITDSAGEVGRTINKIVKLDDIDALVLNISSKINSTNKEIEIKKKDLDELNIDIERFKYYDEIESLVEVIIEQDTKITKNKNICGHLEYIIPKLNEAEITISDIEGSYLDVEQEIKFLEENWVLYMTNKETVKNLTVLTNEVKILDTKIGGWESAVKAQEDCNLFEENVLKYKVMETLNTQLNILLKDWVEHTEKIKILENSIETEEEKFNEILKDYACPLCGRKNN